jgi:6-phosphogluconolactonase
MVVKNRITFTLPLINKAKRVIFLASGPEKKKIVNKILEDPEKSQLLYPSALVHPQGKLTWFVDEGVV